MPSARTRTRLHGWILAPSRRALVESTRIMPRGYPVHVRAHRRIVPQYVVSEVARTSCKRAALRYRLEDVQRPLARPPCGSCAIVEQKWWMMAKPATQVKKMMYNDDVQGLGASSHGEGCSGPLCDCRRPGKHLVPSYEITPLALSVS